MSKSIFNNNKYYESNPFTKNKEHKNRRKDTRHKVKSKGDVLYSEFKKHDEYSYIDEASNIMIEKENNKYYLIYNDGLLNGETCIEFNRYFDLRCYIDKFYDYNKILEDYLKKYITIQIGNNVIRLRTEDFNISDTTMTFNSVQSISIDDEITQARGQESSITYSDDI